jgi:hypothetical protein
MRTWATCAQAARRTKGRSASSRPEVIAERAAQFGATLFFAGTTFFATRRGDGRAGAGATRHDRPGPAGVRAEDARRWRSGQPRHASQMATALLAENQPAAGPSV